MSPARSLEKQTMKRMRGLKREDLFSKEIYIPSYRAFLVDRPKRDGLFSLSRTNRALKGVKYTQENRCKFGDYVNIFYALKGV